MMDSDPETHTSCIAENSLLVFQWEEGSHFAYILVSESGRQKKKQSRERERQMQPHKTRPMTAQLVFSGLNAILVSTISPVYDLVCFLLFWERRRERLRQEREAKLAKGLHQPH